MTNRPKNIGTTAETGVRNFLLSLGYTPMQAKRVTLAGQQDQGDVHLVVNDTLIVTFEVKGGAAAKTASRAQLEAWWDETMTEVLNSGARWGILVTQKAGVSPARAGAWLAHMDLWMFAAILEAQHPLYINRDTDTDHDLVTMELSAMVELIRGL